jgi:hypothetical protein
MERDKLSVEALEARRAYKRKWQRENPERNAEYQRRYWEKRATLLLAEQEADKTNLNDVQNGSEQ